MLSKFDGTCSSCGCKLPKGTEIRYDSKLRKAFHMEDCSIQSSMTPGSAGASAAEMAQKAGQTYLSKEQQTENLKEAFGDNFFSKIAIYLNNLSGPETQGGSWAKGAYGEQVVGAALEGLREFGCEVLHDRRIPNSKANIDHILITPWGVWNVDAKHYPKKAIGWEGENDNFMGLGQYTRHFLTIDGRRNERILSTITWETSHLHRWREGIGMTAELLPISQMVCFVNGQWRTKGDGLWIGGKDSGWTPVVWPQAIARHALVQNSEPFISVPEITALIAKAFPAK